MRSRSWTPRSPTRRRSRPLLTARSPRRRSGVSWPSRRACTPGWGRVQPSSRPSTRQSRSVRIEGVALTDVVGAYRDLFGVIAEAKHAQVDALNAQAFSLDEYAWVKSRFYEAAGVTVTGIDFREMAGQAADRRPEVRCRRWSRDAGAAVLGPGNRDARMRRSGRSRDIHAAADRHAGRRHPRGQQDPRGAVQGQDFHLDGLRRVRAVT